MPVYMTNPPGAVLLEADEWERLIKPLKLTGREDLPEVFHVIAGRLDASYNVAHMVRELIDAGCGGQSVPPRDVPGQIKQLGVDRRRAEHNARTLAGEIADLTHTLNVTLPGVHATIVKELATDLYQRYEGRDIESEDVENVAVCALSLALRLLDSYDMRDRDTARPARVQFAVTLDADPTATFDPALIVNLRLAELGWPYPGCDECKEFAGQAITVRLVPDVEAHFATAHRNAPRPVEFEEPGPVLSDVTHNVYGVAISTAHPAVVYLAEHLGPLKGCDGTLDCRRTAVTRALLDASEDVRVTATTSGDPHDDWIRRAAEHLADLTTGVSLQALAGLTRDACNHAARVILRPDKLTCMYPGCTDPRDPRHHTHPNPGT